MTDDVEEDVAPWDLLADALGSLQELDEPEEDPVLDVLEGQVAVSEDDPDYKVPLERSKNLLKLRRLVDGLFDGSLGKTDFLNSIRPMARSMENGLKLAKSPAVQKQLDEMSEDERAVFYDAQDVLKDILKGIQQMLRYKETDNIADVEEGMDSVERCFQELDEIQDDAIAMDRETREAEVDE